MKAPTALEEFLNAPSDNTAVRVEAEQPATQPELSAVNILMVDDHPENLVALEATIYDIEQSLLKEDPPVTLNLVRATSGPEALRKLLSDEYSVILLDVQMPGMDGYETAQLIRQRARSQRTPIIFLTAINKSDANVFKGYALGAVDYIFKPYDPTVLRAKITVFIDLYRKAQEIQRLADEAKTQAELLRHSNDELAKSNKIMGGLYREVERKSSELVKEQEFTNKIFDTTASFIVILTSEGKIERFNQASREITGYTIENLKGKFGWDVAASPEDSIKVKETFEKAIAGESGACVDLTLRSKKDGLRRVNMTFSPMLDEQNNVVYVIASGLDITERHLAEAKIKQMNEELEVRVLERTQQLREANTDLEREVAERRKAEVALKQAKESAEYANAAKDQFLAVLSHELRTPLTPVLAIVQMLDEDASLPEELRSWVQTIGRNVQLEARLIDDLLDLTRIANGKLQLNQEDVDTDKLIHETLAICQEDITKKCLKLELKLEAKQIKVYADLARLHQVLWNLIKNAVKFTPEGGSIMISTSNSKKGLWRCQVTDTGIGIPADHISTVFNAFDQGDKSITRRFGGLGLGLAISKALVMQHGGTIVAESRGANMGATFTIEIPLLGAKPVSNAKALRTGKNGSAPLQSTGRVLLVEDNADTSQALQMLLERRGYTVIAAHSVESAIEIAKTYHCDVVISDIGLPDGTGIDMIRKLNLIRPTRAIAMSGFGMDDDIRKSLAAGFQAHLVKPVNFDQLNEALQALLVQPAHKST